MGRAAQAGQGSELGAEEPLMHSWVQHLSGLDSIPLQVPS